MNIPTMRDIGHLFLNEEDAIKECILRGIIDENYTCSSCGKTVLVNLKRKTFQHRCTNKIVEVSIFRKTVFSKARLPVHIILHFAYLWIIGIANGAMKIMLGCSDKTVTAYVRYFQQLVANDLTEASCVIGGAGIVVEIDETKLGKRKYHRGHRVDGVWVIVGVERTPERKVFCVAVENRSEETIRRVFEDYVAAGSIVHTDCWKGYSFLNRSDEYTHETVNHSVAFKNTQTGVHTNTVEGTNFALKRSVPIRCRTAKSAPGFLQLFMWKRQHEGDLWNALMQAMKNVKYRD